MAIAYDNATSLNGSGWSSGSSFTFSHTCSGANRYLVVGVYVNAHTSSGVTYGGVSMTLLDSYQDAGSSWVYLYGLVAPATGANNVVITLSASDSFTAAGASSYTGVKQTGQPDSFAHNKTASIQTSLTLTTTTILDNCWLVGIFRNGGTADTNETNAVKRAGYYGPSSGNVSLVDSNSAQTPAGSKSIIQTLISGTANWVGIVISLSPAAISNTSNFFQLF